MKSTSTYRAAVGCFVDLVDQISDDQWDSPGLGVWDIHSLVGHTSRSLSTVSTYLRRPADSEAVTSPWQYYAWAKTAAASSNADAVAERGRQAGRQLGADPADAVRKLAGDALEALAGCGDPLIETIAGGMYLRNYLPTRTFELAVHSLDIADAAELTVALPPEVLAEVTALASRIAVALGDGVRVLTALTGRAALGDSFSVV